MSAYIILIAEPLLKSTDIQSGIQSRRGRSKGWEDPEAWAEAAPGFKPEGHRRGKQKRGEAPCSWARHRRVMGSSPKLRGSTAVLSKAVERQEDSRQAAAFLGDIHQKQDTLKESS